MCKEDDDIEIVGVKNSATPNQAKEAKQTNGDIKVGDLVAMGFDRERAKRCLNVHGGDMSAAINALLSGKDERHERTSTSTLIRIRN